MVISEVIDFPAYTGWEERKVYTYLPKGYDKSDDFYPVLYMFDGQNVFFDEEATYGRSWRLGEFLDAYRIPLIVVAVECHRGEREERMVEYSPYEQVLFRKKEKGFGDKTMKWFIKTLKPLVDEEYRTLPDRNHTFVGGSSMGGILATYCLIRYNRVFSRAISLSPAYYLFIRDLRKTLKECRINKNTTLYTDYGTNDLEVPKSIDIFNNFNIELYKKGVKVTSRIVNGGYHCEECWDKQLVFAINTLMYDLD